jgi:hypothetical protein
MFLIKSRSGAYAIKTAMIERRRNKEYVWLDLFILTILVYGEARCQRNMPARETLFVGSSQLNRELSPRQAAGLIAEVRSTSLTAQKTGSIVSF